MGIDPSLHLGQISNRRGRRRRRIGHAGHAEMDVASIPVSVSSVVSACLTVFLSIPPPPVSLRVHVPHFSWLQVHFSPLKMTEMITVHGRKE